MGNGEEEGPSVQKRSSGHRPTSRLKALAKGAAVSLAHSRTSKSRASAENPLAREEGGKEGGGSGNNGNQLHSRISKSRGSAEDLLGDGSHALSGLSVKAVWPRSKNAFKFTDAILASSDSFCKPIIICVPLDVPTFLLTFI